MVSEGLDIQALDTMILLTPKAKVVQIIGRILRKKPEDYENQPLIIDIVDQIPSFIFLGMARKKVYTARNYEITYNNVKDGHIEKTWEHDYTKDIKPTKEADIGFIDTDDEDKPKKEKKEVKTKKTNDGFIDSENEKPVKTVKKVEEKEVKTVKKVEEKESNKAFEVLETLKSEKEVKKRAPRKKKTEI
jgi:predicted helicase